MYKIVFTPYSKEDISLNKGYIGYYSVIVLQKIFHTISHLSYFPYLGKQTDSNLLEIIDSKYKFRIVYRVDEGGKQIFIVSIFKGKPTWD